MEEAGIDSNLTDSKVKASETYEIASLYGEVHLVRNRLIKELDPRLGQDMRPKVSLPTLFFPQRFLKESSCFP